MKLFHLFLLTFCFQYLSAQCLFEYEEEIKDKANNEYLELDFTNIDDNIELKGTLICPKAGYDKVVIIVPGSGKDTRNSHFVLTKRYLENEIAVYRFDERGIGESEGKYNFTATVLMNDVVFAYQKLRTLEALAGKKIGILGHSLGGIASIGAFEKGCDFDFLIQMATPIEKDGEFLKYQASTNSDGFYTIKNKSTEEVIALMDTLIKMVVITDGYGVMKKKGKRIMKEMDFKKGAYVVVNPLQVDLIKQNHEETYKNSKVPILYIIGSEDRIVSSINETKILERWNNPNVDIKVIENVNHWLNNKIGPRKMEKSLYQMNSIAMSEIVKWTLKN